MKEKKTVVLITSYNCREKTLACLSSLFAALPNGEVFLVDDASTDGIADAVNEKFPQVNIIHGSGNLFWNRGMHLAWQNAAVENNKITKG